MKTIAAVVCCVFAAFGTVSVLNAARQSGENPEPGRTVCVYPNTNYGGPELCFVGSAQISSDGALVASVRVFGHSKIVLYEFSGFRGGYRELNADIPDVGGDYRSFRVEAGPPEPSKGICVYEETGFQGGARCWETGARVPDLTLTEGGSDRISSVRMLGSAVAILYRDPDLRGDQLTVSRNVTDVAVLWSTSAIPAATARGLNNQVTSLEVVDRPPNPASATPAPAPRGNAAPAPRGNTAPAPRGNAAPVPRGNAAPAPRGNAAPTPRGNTAPTLLAGVCVYDLADYKGAEQCWVPGTRIDNLTRLGWGGRISSIKIVGRASVSVYRVGELSGEHIVVTQSIPNLSNVWTTPSSPGVVARPWDRQILSLEVSRP